MKHRDHIALKIATATALKRFGDDLWVVQDEGSIILSASDDFLKMIKRPASDVIGSHMSSLGADKMPTHAKKMVAGSVGPKGVVRVLTGEGDVLNVKVQGIDLEQDPPAFLGIVRIVDQ